MAELGVNEHHQKEVVSYMRFARFKRGMCLKTVDSCFQDLKDSRLVEETFTVDEVIDMLDGLQSVVHSEVESELINTTYTNVLLLRQLFSQAEKWYLKLQTDVSDLENRELLDQVAEFEKSEYTSSNKKSTADPIKPKLAPLNEGGSELLNKATAALDEKSKLEKSLRDLQMIQGDQKNNANQDITELENKVAALKSQFEKTLNDTTANQKFLEEDLVTTKHDLLKVQDQLSTAEKELEKKFQQTAAYRNMKEILTKKNEQIKDLRRRLSNIRLLPDSCPNIVAFVSCGFLIPYLIMLIAEGMPLLYLELAVGQRMRQGSIGAWKIISPYLCGVGVASVVVSFFLSMYYNVINAWAFWYLFHSFQDPLPWATCPLNSNRTGYEDECEKTSSTQYFWYRQTLNISPSLEASGSVQWEQALCLTLAWLVVYLCILRGTASTGKVVYVTASLPYCVLIIYLIRGLTLHGAVNGLVYMFTPKLEQLLNPKTWISAATQIFFSLGLGFGSLIAFASYNEPSNNCQRHAIIVSLINSTTSIFASIVTFSIYGFKATFNYESCINKVILLLLNAFDLEEGSLTADNLNEMKDYLMATYPQEYAQLAPQIKNCSLEAELDTAVQGTGLAFIVYSEAIKNMEVPQLYSVLYFFMLLMLGIGSMLGNTAAILTPLTDSRAIASRFPKEVISGVVCFVNCIIGLIFTMEAGNYWFDIFNDYAATLSLLLIVLVETIAVCYIYGIRRFEKDLYTMIGHKPNWYWKIMWAFGQLVTKDYPGYALAVIGLLVAASTMCIPLGALVTFIRKRLKRERISTVA
ncbi:Sodium- and chloride-dependent transporter XTRP3A [Turdus rufiventris]|nr:Sodium- and chloride-dependent transporter XTRP3A [Turdus rufiventris]